MNDQIFLQPISDKIHEEAVNLLSSEYNFLNGSENGGKMRLANYFVGISESLSNEFIARESYLKYLNDYYLILITLSIHLLLS